ncbi:MAG: response regulator [Calditrichaceae bacterium]|nr:response regulator [Calditrichaceae bacterium]
MADKKILIVEDDLRNVFSLKVYFEEKDIEILTAENGRIALDMLDNDPGIDLVLMDIMMPEMDGYQAMTEIRKQERFKELPVIALTAKAMTEDQQRCLDAGANAYLSKPVNIDELELSLKRWL